jgi:hypothetical protein
VAEKIRHVVQLRGTGELELMVAGRGELYCRACSGANLFLALDLGESPIANNLLDSPENDSPSFPLELRVCLDCKLGQIGEFISPGDLFDDYPYFSSTSRSWLQSSEIFARSISETFRIESEHLVLEIASNDGYQLKFFQEIGIQVLGVEPAANIAEIANVAGIPTRTVFFGLQTAEELLNEGVRPRLIVAKNVLAHVPDLRDFVAGISLLCREDTVVVVEAPTILQISKDNQFDTVYHEHFSYLSTLSIKKLLANHGLELFGVEKLNTHGGSLRFFARANDSTVKGNPSLSSTLQEVLEEEQESGFGEVTGWKSAQHELRQAIQAFANWLNSAPKGTNTIGYGAAAKSVTLLSLASDIDQPLQVVIDNSPGKIGKFLPVAKVAILSEKDFVETMGSSPNRYVIFPWNLKSEILPRIRAIDPSAEVVTAVPKLERL